MAILFIEGFDKYGPVGENSPTVLTLLQQGEWTSQSSGGGTASYTLISALAGSTGRAFQIIDSNGVIKKTLASNYSRIIGGVRMSASGPAANFHGVQFTDGGTAQFSVGYNVSTGTVSIRTGGGSGTALGTTGFLASNGTVNYLEWDVTIGTSASYNVYWNGVSVLSGTGNTRGGTSTSQVNQIVLGILTAAGNSTGAFDDLYLMDTTGSVNNAVLLTSPRVETRFPSGDSQTQWTNAGNTIPAAGILQTGVSNLTTTTNAPGGAILALVKITPSVSCTLQSVGALPAATSAAAKFKAVLYSDSGGNPNTLTATGTEVIGTTSGTALTLPFAAGQALTGGTSYWIGFIGDTSVAFSQFDNATNLGQKKTNTYASGAPAGPLSGMTTAQPTWEFWGNATGAAVNWVSVAHNPADATGAPADNGTISSSTVNNEDLYSFPSLTSNVVTVHSIAVKVNMKKSDAGARTIDCRLKSSTTDSAGSNAGIALGTSYSWYSSVFDTDPATSAAWTVSAANAAVAGPKVAS